MADYSKMTDEEFDAILDEKIANTRAAEMLNIPGVYEVLAEYFNNDILDTWAEENPRKAYPEDYEEGEDE